MESVEILGMENVRVIFRELFLTLKLVTDHIKAFDKAFCKVEGHPFKKIGDQKFHNILSSEITCLLASFENTWKRSFHKIKMKIVAELDSENQKNFKKNLTEKIAFANKKYYSMISKSFNDSTGDIKRSINEF